MKKLSIVFILIMGIMNAQNQRFTYEYKFAKYETDKDSLRSEMMALDVTEAGSEFYSWDKKESDSIMMADLEKQLKTTGKIRVDKSKSRGAIKYKVSKKYPDFKVEFLDNFGGYKYQVEDARKMNWKISSETKKIGEWDCQKATTEFAGRKWEAWFTPAIPITDGPYKFRGLPGLIVEAKCEEGVHHFTLKGVKRLPKKVENIKGESNVSFSFGGSRKPIKLSLKKYAKQKAKYLEDPSAGLRQMINSGQIQVSSNGNSASNADVLRELSKKKKQKKRTPIELDLVK